MEYSLKNQWIPCPACGGNTRTKVREDTVLYHQPLQYGFQVAKISMKEQTVDFECRSQSDCVHEQAAKADCE